jgi:hypothetical protein
LRRERAHEDLQEVDFDCGGIRHRDLVQLERATPPKCDLLKRDEVRPGSDDFLSEQLGPDRKVGLVDDVTGRVRAVRQRYELREGARWLREGGAQRRAEIRSEIEISRHHRQRLAWSSRRSGTRDSRRCRRQQGNAHNRRDYTK